jgi:hypothetical protein
MPTDIRIIHAHDFIKATPEGHLDLEESKRLLVELTSATASLDDYDIILDTRKTQSEMSMLDLLDLAAELDNLRKDSSRKTAIVCPFERFDHAGFFARHAQNRGFRVRAFTCFEDAINWLMRQGIEPLSGTRSTPTASRD